MIYRRVKSYEPMHKLMLRFLKNITTFLFFSDRTHIHFFIKNHENAWKSYLGEISILSWWKSRKFWNFQIQKKNIQKNYFRNLWCNMNSMDTVFRLHDYLWKNIHFWKKLRLFKKSSEKNDRDRKKKTIAIGFWLFS